MNVFLSRSGVLARSLPRIFSQRFVASSAKEKTEQEEIDISSLEEQMILLENSDAVSEEEIERKRNKSRLGDGDRRVLFDSPPNNEAIHRFEDTVKYKRRMFGRYGMEASDVPLGIAWPTKQEVEDMKEYEAVAYPETIQQTWDRLGKRRAEETAAVRARDKLIAQNLGKLEKWTADLNAKVAKKEAEAKEARERKERLIEEVRRHFGYKISPKDERFKEVLAQKDKADKKLKKAAKKEAKAKKMMALIAEKSASLYKNDKETGSTDGKNEDNVQS